MKVIFIPVFKEFYKAYVLGTKTYELRGAYGGFSPNRIKSGFKAVVSCGYGQNHRRNATIGAVYLYNSIDAVKSSGLFNKIVPDALQGSNIDEFLNNYALNNSHFIVFELKVYDKGV